ncbi:MAG: TetR/AcrR family transcriptional regulator [Pseudomonadales bacterium]
MSRSSNNPTSDTAARRWGAGQRVDNPEQGVARILAAARQCYAESSVASATIDQIAQQAGVSRRTVYRYFDNKEAIILAVVEEQAEPFFEQMRESLAGLKTENFRQLLVHCVLFTVKHGPQVEGHQLLLGGKNATATANFYLRSVRMRKNLHALLGEKFQQAQQAGDINQAWCLDDLLNWLGRLVYSFIQYPEPKENVERLVTQYLLPD